MGHTIYLLDNGQISELIFDKMNFHLTTTYDIVLHTLDIYTELCKIYETTKTVKEFFVLQDIMNLLVREEIIVINNKEDLINDL